MTACLHCSHPLEDAAMPVHPECLADGIVQEAVVGVLGLLALFLVPTVVVMAA